MHILAQPEHSHVSLIFDLHDKFTESITTKQLHLGLSGKFNGVVSVITSGDDPGALTAIISHAR